MIWLALKAGISGVLIAIASTLAKRYPGFGALIASLPLVSVLGMVWLWNEKPDTANMAAHASATFCYVIPSAADVPPDPRAAGAWDRLLACPPRRVLTDDRALHRPDVGRT